MQRVRVIDSHTGGEPTRVVIDGAPDLGGGTVADQCAVFRTQHDRFRSAVVNEPRGSDVLVGALLVKPREPACAAGVIFFNNVGVLGMCGHGMIGVIATLAHQGAIGVGEHRLETPVGIVTTSLHEGGSVSLENVPTWRAARSVTINVDGFGPVTGDVAWGGNWFFLIEQHGQEIALANVGRLADFAGRVRLAVNAQGFPEIDHVDLFGPARNGGDSQNFVLCPGGAYDRSPCGTGTSAKLACLAADGKLAEGATWVQESILGSTLRGTFHWLDRAAGRIVPTITGEAHIMTEATLLLDPRDPFCWGITSRA